MIDREDRDGIAIVRMAHGKANALDVELLRGLIAELDALERESASALILTGSGSIFCAGVDLFRLLDGGAAYVESFLPLLGETFHKLLAFPRPVIGAANGHAIAGGCILLCACDLRLLVDDNARVGVPELYVGVPLPNIALELLRFCVASQHLQRVIYSGLTFTPDDALGCGLVDELIPADKLLDTALERAARLASVPPDTYALSKSQLRAPLLARAAEGGARDAEAIHKLWTAPHTLEFIRGYLDRLFGTRH